jgi:hypothetical protein
MLHLNFSNVEELIFFDEKVQKLLPDDMFSIFEQWRMAKRIPFLKGIGKQAMLDFLNLVNDQNIDILEQYFGEQIYVERIDYSIVKNFKIPISEKIVCEELCKIMDLIYYSTWRDEEYIYISFWR